MKAFTLSLFHSGSCHIGWSLGWSNAWIKSENRATGWNIQPSPGTTGGTGATCSIATKAETGKLLHTVFCSYHVSTVRTLQDSCHTFTFYCRCCSRPGAILVQFQLQPGRPAAIPVILMLRDMCVYCCIQMSTSKCCISGLWCCASMLCMLCTMFYLLTHGIEYRRAGTTMTHAIRPLLIFSATL